MTFEQISYLGSAFTGLCLAGFYFAYLYGRKTKRFLWREYIAILLLPIVCVVMLVYIMGPKILMLFIVSSLMGFFLEYIIGLTYHKTLNERLWQYNRLSINGYTSLLSVPIWGIAGVVFYFLSKMIGL